MPVQHVHTPQDEKHPVWAGEPLRPNRAPFNFEGGTDAAQAFSHLQEHRLVYPNSVPHGDAFPAVKCAGTKANYKTLNTLAEYKLIARQLYADTQYILLPTTIGHVPEPSCYSADDFHVACSPNRYATNLRSLWLQLQYLLHIQYRLH